MNRIFVVFGVLVALGACGGDDDDVAADADADAPAPAVTTTTLDPDAAVSSPPLDPGATVDPGTGGATRVEPRPGMANLHPVSFDPAAAEARDGSVVVRFYGGVDPCFVLDRYEVTETDESVTIALHAGSDPAQPDSVCIELAQLYEVEVPLAAPLGTRELRSAA
ncbi:MAG: hypothetical protein ACT4OX_15955 [Actinomycetota bacterium]